MEGPELKAIIGLSIALAVVAIMGGTGIYQAIENAHMLDECREHKAQLQEHYETALAAETKRCDGQLDHAKVQKSLALRVCRARVDALEVRDAKARELTDDPNLLTETMRWLLEHSPSSSSSSP